MMRRIAAAVLTMIVLLTIPALTARSTDVQDELYRQAEEILSDSGTELTIEEIGQLTFGDIMGRVRSILSQRLQGPLRMLGTLLAVVVFSAAVRGALGTVLTDTEGMYDMVCVVMAVTAALPQLLTLYQDTLAVIVRSGGFIKVFVPVFTVISAVCGGITSGGIYDMAVLGASELIVALSDHYLIPLLSVTAVLAVSGSMFPEGAGESLSGLLKRLSTWSISVVMMLFTGFVSLKCTIAGKTDGFGVKTAKYVISGAVPIVGGAVSDAYSAVRGSFEIMRGAVGYGGMIALLLIMLPPVIEILIYRCVMWIGTAAAELFSAGAAARLIRGFDSGLAIAQCILVCYGMMFMICSAILLRSMG